MKVRVFGFRGLFNITELLERYFVDSFKWQLVDTNPDVIIHLTGGFEEAQQMHLSCKKKPIRLYLLLDIDPSKPLEWYNQIKQDLLECEIPCVISGTVKTDVELKLGINGLHIVPYPTQPFKFEKCLKTIQFLYSGRCMSVNKRFDLGIRFLQEVNFDPRMLIVAGTERPPVGLHAPNLPTEELNSLFNSSAFLLSPSSFEGQNLNVIQAVITRTLPLICQDCLVNHELGLSEFCAEPTALGMARKFSHMLEFPQRYYEILDELRPKFEQKYSVGSMAQKIKVLIEQFLG